MFEETLVVQSAISAFNNSALVAPTFFWIGLLATPLMAMAYFCGADFLRRIGWQQADIVRNSVIFTVILVLLWLISFGGNYSVLRDSGSLLPFCVAAVVAACSVMLGVMSRGRSMPKLRGMLWRKRIVLFAGVAVVTFLVGFSGLHTWWGILTQVIAFWGGIALGRYWRRADAPMPICLGVIIAMSALMLMQPEFFRFGQLGTLTLVHMGALLIVGASASAVFVLRNVRASGRIHHSAYVKLKWMMRFVTLLAIALFILTESVPVFIGTIAAATILFAMSVWHAETVPDSLAQRILAIALGGFGVITTLPVISALGVMVWVTAPKGNLGRDAKFLL